MFYQRFIKGFSTIATHMTNCISKDEFVLTLEVSHAFLTLKEIMTTTHVLQLSDFLNIFEVACDASGTGIGGSQSQEGHPVAFFSEKLNDVKQWYSAYDKEFYAIVQSLKQWRHYLLHKKFMLYSDHQTLSFLNA